MSETPEETEDPDAVCSLDEDEDCCKAGVCNGFHDAEKYVDPGLEDGQ